MSQVLVKHKQQSAGVLLSLVTGAREGLSWSNTVRRGGSSVCVSALDTLLGCVVSKNGLKVGTVQSVSRVPPAHSDPAGTDPTTKRALHTERGETGVRAGKHQQKKALLVENGDHL